MKRTMSLTIAVMVLSGWVTAIAQEKDKKADPFDFSATDKIVKELGVPTVEQVAALETKAKELYAAGNYTAAIPALDEYARKANWLANLIAAALQPYYTASYDARKRISPKTIEMFVPLEEKANQYKRKRNAAMVFQAECLAKTGNKDRAVSLLVKALDLIDVDDPMWPVAAGHLLPLIGVQ